MTATSRVDNSPTTEQEICRLELWIEQTRAKIAALKLQRDFDSAYRLCSQLGDAQVYLEQFKILEARRACA